MIQKNKKPKKSALEQQIIQAEKGMDSNSYFSFDDNDPYIVVVILLVLLLFVIILILRIKQIYFMFFKG